MTKLKTAAFAPVPTATVSRTTAVDPGVRANARGAYRTSATQVLIRDALSHFQDRAKATAFDGGHSATGFQVALRVSHSCGRASRFPGMR